MDKFTELENTIPDLSFLDEAEKAKILDVLNRDQQLRRKQTEKYLKLKQEIELIESKSIDIPSDHVQTATVCVRCRQPFGYFFNKGDFCQQCSFKVCQKCRINQVGSGFLFSNRNENKILWLCILCHKYNQFLVQTGEWIYNQRLQDSSAESRVKWTSESSSFVKSPLSGSQLITLSLCPTKKEEIIQEIESVNFNKTSLSKRYSTIKKARSQSLHSEKAKQSKEVISSQEPPSMAKSIDNLSSVDNKTKSVSIANDRLVNGSKSGRSAPLADEDDLESITSSEFDNNSIFVNDATRLVKHKIDANEHAKSHEILKYAKKTDSSSNHSSILDLANRNVKDANEQLCMTQRDKSHTSLSAFRGTADQDNEMNQMDQLFENFKNLKNPKRQDVKSKFAYKRDLNRENAIHSVPASPMTNAGRHREASIDPVDEYLQLQLQQHEHRSDTKPMSKINKSNHMSLMRKAKNPFSNFERTISIKSINEHFSHDPSIKISGRICVKLFYEKKSSNLSVNIHSCDNLALVKKDCPNAYVKVYLKSNDNEKDKNMKRKTPVIKNNQCPIFDETLRYTISSSELDIHRLEISVWHKDKFGRNKFLGEVTISLNSDIGERASNQWYELTKGVQTSS